MSNRFQSAPLSVMMFLQFFVWGAWYVTVGNFMVEEGMGDITHWAYTVGPLAAILSPFFLGMISDRYFDVEKVLGVLHLLGGGTLLIAPMFSSSPTTFIVVIGVHMLCWWRTSYGCVGRRLWRLLAHGSLGVFANAQLEYGPSSSANPVCYRRR